MRRYRRKYKFKGLSTDCSNPPSPFGLMPSGDKILPEFYKSHTLDLTEKCYYSDNAKSEIKNKG